MPDNWRSAHTDPPKKRGTYATRCRGDRRPWRARWDGKRWRNSKGETIIFGMPGREESGDEWRDDGC